MSKPFLFFLSICSPGALNYLGYDKIIVTDGAVTTDKAVKVVFYHKSITSDQLYKKIGNIFGINSKDFDLLEIGNRLNNVPNDNKPFLNKNCKEKKFIIIKNRFSCRKDDLVDISDPSKDLM